MKRELEKEREEDRRHEAERMADLKREKEEDRRHEDERMAELMRELKESKSNDMKSVYVLQVGMVVLGCVAAGLAIYIHFSRPRNASDGTKSLV